MDDSCAVCAETLEWVAYGGCGHKEVCSTCVVRLRFILHDRRCCICKSDSDLIFVTKALGDYTRMISDFSVFPSGPKEGRVGAYWYHEDTQAFFDDVDHYKMIKAMCRLSCSMCDHNKTDDQPKPRPRLFRNIEQLKGHLFHHHKLFMCSLCLEGRKVFICEQKLYTRAQLNQHISTGDSEVDGSESERGGFTGHPVCDFCRTSFYGDNELYSHMSTEHYTCHICQRQHPGQYEYYKNYDDLELHFRREHFLCEDETCLAKKFIVFQSEAEFKRHNTLEHAGRMSRSQRHAALQIPTSFRYRRSNEQESRRGRGLTFLRDSENDLSMAIEASLETANLDGRVPAASSSPTFGSQEIVEVDPLISPFESVAMEDSELSSKYREALSLSSRNAPLQESSFPPLPIASGNSQSRSHQDATTKNSMAALFRSRGNVNVLNKKGRVPAPARPVARHIPAPPMVSPRHAWPTLDDASASVSAPGSGQNKTASENGPSLSSYSSSAKARAASVRESSSASYSQSGSPEKYWPALSNSSGSASISGASKPATDNGSTFSASVKAKLAVHGSSSSGFYSSSRNSGSTSKISHSASAPNLVGSGSFDSSATDFPPVSAAQLRKLPTGSQVVTKVEDVRNANKSLVERIRIALNLDEDKYSAFKDISGEYRQGLIDAETYLVSVEQFGLSHLVPELASLLPDARKQIELIQIYNANMVSDVAKGNGQTGAFHLNAGNGSKKGKEKSVDAGSNTSKDNLADSVMTTVRKLQSSHKASEEVEVLTKDGYRAAKGKSKVGNNESQVQLGSLGGETIKLKGQPDSPAGGGSNQSLGEGDGKNKPRKKTSKFHRVRLGDDSAAAILDLKNLSSDPDPDPGVALDGQNQLSEGLPVRGAWRNGGGQKLLARRGK